MNRATRHSDIEPARELTVQLLGIDFSWASLAERERLAYDADQACALLRRARALPDLAEAAVLSTCNRTEFYLVGRSSVTQSFLELVRRDRPDAGPHSTVCALRHEVGLTAVRHLFAVATGVESRILGDTFIVRQIKSAQRCASQSGTLGPVISRAFEQAFTVAHRARTTTAIASGESGLGAIVAAHIASQAPPNPRIVIVGAGMTARDVARQVAKRRLGALTIINRTREAADALARLCGGQVTDWSEWAIALTHADVVVCATSARMPIITRSTFGDRTPILIDLGVPRNIEIGDTAPCITVDELVERQVEARARREQARPAVEALIDGELDIWRQWLAARPVERLIKGLFQDEAAARRQMAIALVESGWSGSAQDVELLLGRWTGHWLKRHAAELRLWARSASSGSPVAGSKPLWT